MIKFSDLKIEYLQRITKDCKTVYNRRDENGKYYYYNIECSFDIETSSVIVDGDKSAFMYIWMFEIGYDNEVIIGRSWQEFKQLLSMVKQVLKLDEFHNLVCYIHNMSFEFQFIKDLIQWKNVFAVDERKPIKALSAYDIEFRDSYILSGLNLEKTADNLVSHTVKKQVGSLDYDLVRTPETKLTDKELLYCVDDVKIVCAYIAEQIKQYGTISRIPLTNTGRVRKLVSFNCFYTSKSHKKSSGSKYRKYRKLMKDLTIKDEHEYNMLQRAFQGGYTHASALHVGKTLHSVHSYDFTSSYPTVMLSELYPMSRAVELKPYSLKELDQMCKKYCLIFNVEFVGITQKIDQETYLSDSKCFNVKDKIVNNGRIVKAEQLQTTITNVDFDIIKACYTWDQLKIGKVIGYYKGYLPKPIIESILDLYQKKTTLKNIKGKEAEYLNSKGMLNSIYGMSVTNIIQDLNTFDNEQGWFNEPANIADQIEKYNKSSKRFLYYPWGIFVTAYARRNLWSGILACGTDYCYSDTDSIKCLNMDQHQDYITKYNSQLQRKLKRMTDHYNIDPALLSPKTIQGKIKPIGLWDNEGTYTTFKTLGAKRYITFQDNELHSTIAGLSKKNGIKYMFEKSGSVDGVFKMFTNDLFIPATNTGKNTHTYIDDPMHYIIKDFKGKQCEIKTPSGVHLGKCEFTLSLSQQYISFLNHLANGELYKGVEFVQ